MKQLKIEIPEGYEIDREKSTFENIVFKQIYKDLPKSVYDIKQVCGFPIDGMNAGRVTSLNPQKSTLFQSQSLARAATALAQISQLLPKYGGELFSKKPGYNPCIHVVPRYIQRSVETQVIYNVYSGKANSRIMVFEEEEMATLFLKNFESLIKDASILLYHVKIN